MNTDVWNILIEVIILYANFKISKTKSIAWGPKDGAAGKGTGH